jgi:hypothetical protein
LSHEESEKQYSPPLISFHGGKVAVHRPRTVQEKREFGLEGLAHTETRELTAADWQRVLC